jgi:microsomal dipeptidase-like Zn-dependent dipeptidase
MQLHILKNNLEFYRQQISTLKNVRPMLAVEGGCVLAGDINRVGMLRDAGVKILTLTWNGDNESAAVSNSRMAD